VLGLAAIVLAAVTVRATELYATRYQSLPVLDWIESRPPFAESANVPASEDLARGLSYALPLLTIRDDARSRLPDFGPPGVFQRTIGGVRDASRIDLGSPGTFGLGRVPVDALLDAIVFDRALRAQAWSELMGREMDIRDPESGQYQARVAGPDEPDGVWVGRPDQAGGVATVVGHRGPVGFKLKVTFARLVSSNSGDVANLTDLSARAEVLARQSAADWTAWLAQQLTAA
jgi:hypothetical protein